MTGVVIDACVVIDALTSGAPEGQAARAALARYQLSAPAILTGEVLSVVWRRTRHSSSPLPLPIADSAAAALPGLRIELVPASPSDVARAWALRHNVRPTDALYVALAERLGVPLLTSDRQLHGSLVPAKLTCPVFEP